jgi:hypothetical protein
MHCDIFLFIFLNNIVGVSLNQSLHKIFENPVGQEFLDTYFVI